MTSDGKKVPGDTMDATAPGEPLRFLTCLPADCLVPLTFDAASVAALGTGTALRITATVDDSGQNVALSISLAGFTSTLARLAALSTE